MAVKMLDYAKRLKAMAHLGLTYANNEYDQERYRELEQISLEMMQQVSGQSLEKNYCFFRHRKRIYYAKN